MIKVTFVSGIVSAVIGLKDLVANDNFVVANDDVREDRIAA